jgi:dephospho-CoA kinase
VTRCTKAADTPRDKLVIGLAGGVASGKSLVAGVLADLGAAVIDSDRMAHEELENPEVIATFRQWWGPQVCTPSGAIDRAAMADVIFNRPDERARMEAYLYPRLEERRVKLMNRYCRDAAVTAIVLNSPLLYDVGLDRVCDTVIFVSCEREQRVQRVADSRGWTEAELDRREKLQKPLDEKERLADHVVINDSSVDALRSLVTDLFHRLLTDYRSARGLTQ